MEIGQVAKESGFNASAIRYYESVGILPKPSRSSGRRIYSAEVLTFLKILRLARSLGFRTQEMKMLFSDVSSGKVPKLSWRELVESKLQEIKIRKRELLTMEKFLQKALECKCLEIKACEKFLKA
jgi:MerR family transcriptional regulator, redox-sensitive transcriptional activator SoxR